MFFPETSLLESTGKVGMQKRKAMSGIPQNIKTKVENINALKEKLFQWKKLKEDNLFSQLKEFEKTPRLEVSLYYNDLLNDPKLAATFIDIYQEHKNNAKLTVLIVSAIGNMMLRYKLPETKQIYDFMLENAYKKNIAPYVAIFLSRMEYFTTYEDRWKYFMDVKEMVPKKIAESSFELIMGSHLDEIPEAYKLKVREYFIKKAEDSNNEYGRQYYLDIAGKIK